MLNIIRSFRNSKIITPACAQCAGKSKFSCGHRPLRKLAFTFWYEKNKKEGGSYQKTNNIKKLEKRIKLVHRRLNGIRNNHLHQATNKIVKTKPSKVVVETLNIKGMMKNKHLSKAIQQQKLHEFKRQVQYKCKFNGI
jgi:IS605 OrfB family transposase